MLALAGKKESVFNNQLQSFTLMTKIQSLHYQHLMYLVADHPQ